MLNHVTVMGRLTADPDLRHTQTGVATATFRLAVDRDFKDQNGTKQTDFLPVVCWRQTAEFASKYLAKGRLAVVSGRIQVREYTDKAGQKRNVTEIVADSVYFGDNKRPDTDQKTAPADPFSGLTEVDDNDIPF